MSRAGAHNPTYNTWTMMKQRCYNALAPDFRRYGGRGIKVCDEWRRSYDTFLADMGERPAGTTLHRKDNNGSYCKDNCVWASANTQQNLKSTSVLVTHAGETLSLSQWGQKLGLGREMLYKRYQQFGPNPDKLFGPVGANRRKSQDRRNSAQAVLLTYGGETKTITEWSKLYGVNRQTMFSRLTRGWSADEVIFGR